MSESKQNTITSLLKYWPILTALVFIAIAWGTLKADAVNQEKRLETVEARLDLSSSNQQTILVQLSQIQADLSWIKLKLK